MRLHFSDEVEHARRVHPDHGGSPAGANYGWFVFANGLRVMLTTALGWEHVSVSRSIAPPSWDDMLWVRRLFWRPEEWVMQLYPPDGQYIGLAANAVHLWRPTMLAIPTPPLELF